MATSFDFDILAFANDAVAEGKFHREIDASSITAAVDAVSRNAAGKSADTVTVDFATDLTAGEETTLNALVAAHDGVAAPKGNDEVRFKSGDGSVWALRVDNAGAVSTTKL